MYQELLAIARELAAREAGRPRKEALARAVSTAYYALFHAVAEFCGRELVGTWTPWQPFRHIYRSLDHAAARTVFDGVRRPSDLGEDAAFVAEAFLLLQKLRHAADYDPGFRTVRREVIGHIDRAEEAAERLNRIPPAERKLLAARLIGRARKT